MEQSVISKHAKTLNDCGLESLDNLIALTDFTFLDLNDDVLNAEASMFNLDHVMYRPEGYVSRLVMGDKLRKAVNDGDFSIDPVRVFNDGADDKLFGYGTSSPPHMYRFIKLPVNDPQLRNEKYGFKLRGIKGIFVFYDSARDIEPISRPAQFSSAGIDPKRLLD